MIIILVIPTLSHGGAERVMSELANIWSSQGHEIHLILLAEGEQFYLLADNIIIHRLGFKINQNPIQKLFSLLKMLIQLRKLISKLNPSFVLSFMNKYNIFTLISTYGLKQRIIVSERDSPTEKLPDITNKLRKATYPLAYGVITQTELSKLFIQNEIGNKNTISIPNPLKEISFDSNIKKEKIILNVGRLVPKKGQHHLLEAFAKMNLPDWKLVLLGEGDLRKELEKRVSELGLDNNVMMPGAVKNIDEWLQKSSIFAFPSLFEGFPNALAEAMASGLACVSFDCDTGPRDLIQDGKNGFLIQVGDVELLTNRLHSLVIDDSLRMQFSHEAKKIGETLNRYNIAKYYLDFCTKVDVSGDVR